MFTKYYKQNWTKRFLSVKKKKNVSDDAEKSLIVKLKTDCGYRFTSKLEGMFIDTKTSEDAMLGFYANSFAKTGDNPTLAVQIFTIGFWSTQPSATCNLPAEFLGVCEKFQGYCFGTYTRRRLSWQTNMGFAFLVISYDVPYLKCVRQPTSCILAL